MLVIDARIHLWAGAGSSPRHGSTPFRLTDALKLVVDHFGLVMNMPRLDDILLSEAGVTIDRALFPLLIGIERFGPIGVSEIADRAGRDHTTVSRQVARLADLGLIERRPSRTDRRVNEAVLTGEGRNVIDALDAARHRLNVPVFSEWSDRDLLELERLLRRYVDDLQTRAATLDRADTRTRHSPRE